MKVGDIVVNPWVPKYIQGYLNRLYATIYIGNNKTIDYEGTTHKWASKIYVESPEDRTPWRVIGNVDIIEIISNEIFNAVEDEQESIEQ